MALYSNKTEKFQIVDFLATHNQLLLRCFKTSIRDYNIDVILKGVTQLFLPTEINGIEIFVLDNEETIKFLTNKFSFSTKYDKRIFKIVDSGGNFFYINALCFGIYHNKLDILETSLERYDMENFGELQKWFAD